MFWRFARQHNATLWFEKLFTTTNKIQAEKLWEAAKAAEWCCLHPDLHSFFCLRLQQSGPCFLQALTILLAAVSVHLFPQLDLFRGRKTIGKLKLMSISTAEAHGQCAVHPPSQNRRTHPPSHRWHQCIHGFQTQRPGQNRWGYKSSVSHHTL